MAASPRWVYYFGKGKADGSGDQKKLLGGKGAGLAEMTRIGLPVPAGFTVTTEACAEVLGRDGAWPAGLDQQIRKMVARLERDCRKKFGDEKNPLMVSVRSGAAVSMPGMMETILNLGLTDKSVEGLANVSKNRRFAFDAYRRLITMFGSTAKGVERRLFDEVFEDVKRTRTAARLDLEGKVKATDADINTEEFEEIVDRFKKLYEEQCHEPFPQDPYIQLKSAIDAVFNSWNADKAVTYRRVERISGLNGTAVNVCQMVFGNMGEDSGTGVCFTRDPNTGEDTYYGDALLNAQGEDVVAGVRTPFKLEQLREIMPEAYDQLEAVRVMLEVHYKDMQDLEFTIERGKLYMLQCRTGKRSPAATFKIAVDQATKGIVTPAAARKLVSAGHLPKRYLAAASKPVITREEAILRIKGEHVERLFYPILDPDLSRDELSGRCLGEGVNAVPGAAYGEIAFSAEAAQARAAEDKKVILVRHETSPEDVGGMSVSAGILTASGGKTSHAAVVARGWGKCCIVGCEDLDIDYGAKSFSINGRTLREGDTITLDGSTGRIYEGQIGLVTPSAPPEYETLMSWCDKLRRLRVRTNADTPADARRAVSMGAEGIGLCRTEHMFFDSAEPQRIRAMREMILALDEESRRRALSKLLPFQRADFDGVFEAMDGKPVTIRLLDPPLHEFLPHADNPQGQQAVVDELNGPLQEELARVEWWDHQLRHKLEAQLVTLEEIQRRVEQLKETNPMLGHRGCRLCITYPEILDMQVRAIMQAAINCSQRGINVLPEIMIPLTIDSKELAILVDRVRAVAEQVMQELDGRVKYMVGTMVETVRAALLADEMAEQAEFFSFGTNDLTQMTLALSRDDAGRFLPDYVDSEKAGIFPDHPFQSIDLKGVGKLMRMAVELGREARPGLKIGICGEHGGDPQSVWFCDELGLDYVSCSPFRVPIARLAAAQSVIRTAASRPRRKPAPKKTAAAKKIKVKAKAKKTAKTKTKKKATAKKARAQK